MPEWAIARNYVMICTWHFANLFVFLFPVTEHLFRFSVQRLLRCCFAHCLTLVIGAKEFLKITHWLFETCGHTFVCCQFGLSVLRAHSLRDVWQHTFDFVLSPLPAGSEAKFNRENSRNRLFFGQSAWWTYGWRYYCLSEVSIRTLDLFITFPFKSEWKRLFYGMKNLICILTTIFFSL